MKVDVPSVFLAKYKDKIQNDAKTKVFALETWYRYMYPYIPYRTGVLASTTHLNYHTGEMIKQGITVMENGKETTKTPAVSVTPDGIHFAVPYAARMYFGEFNFSKEMHPLADNRWGEKAFDYHGASILEEIKQFILRGE